MAADPVAAANALAGQTYADAKDRTAAGKQALLNQLSTQGNYNNALDQQTAAAAAPSQPSAPADINNMGNQAIMALATHGAQQIQQSNQNSIMAANALAASQRAGQQQAANTYFDQVASAIPIEQSRAASSGAQVLGDLQAKREAAAAAHAQAAIQLQISQAELAKAKMAATTGNPYTNLTADQKFVVKGTMEKQAANDAIPTSYAKWKQNPDGSMTQTNILNPTGQAIHDIISSGMTLPDALSKNGLDDTAAAEVARQANLYYQSLSQQGYYTNFGGQPPTITVPTVHGGLQDTLLNLAGGGNAVPGTQGTSDPSKYSWFQGL